MCGLLSVPFYSINSISLRREQRKMTTLSAFWAGRQLSSAPIFSNFCVPHLVAESPSFSLCNALGWFVHPSQTCVFLTALLTCPGYLACLPHRHGLNTCPSACLSLCPAACLLYIHARGIFYLPFHIHCNTCSILSCACSPSVSASSVSLNRHGLGR